MNEEEVQQNLSRSLYKALDWIKSFDKEVDKMALLLYVCILIRKGEYTDEEIDVGLKMIDEIRGKQ